MVLSWIEILFGLGVVWPIMNWIQEKTGYNKWVERTVNRLFGRNTETQGKKTKVQRLNQ